jgi:hypothetical protein
LDLKYILKSKIDMAGAFRFELKTSVLETDILPIETTRLKAGVSDGNRTRNIRFGRPALSRLSFAHKFCASGKSRTSKARNAPQFYRLLAFADQATDTRNKKIV